MNGVSRDIVRGGYTFGMLINDILVNVGPGSLIKLAVGGYLLYDLLGGHGGIGPDIFEEIAMELGWSGLYPWAGDSAWLTYWGYIEGEYLTDCSGNLKNSAHFLEILDINKNDL